MESEAGQQLLLHHLRGSLPSNYSILRQICSAIPPHQVFKIARETGAEENAGKSINWFGHSSITENTQRSAKALRDWVIAVGA
jgi:hypothetical protein